MGLSMVSVQEVPLRARAFPGRPLIAAGRSTLRCARARVSSYGFLDEGRDGGQDKSQAGRYSNAFATTCSGESSGS